MNYIYRNTLNIENDMLKTEFNEFIINTIYNRSMYDNKNLITNLYCSDDKNYKNNQMDKYIGDHLFLVTVQFTPGVFAAKNGYSMYDDNPIFTEFRGWYIKLCSNLLGNRSNKKKDRQPFVMAFLDVEGSRNHKSAKAFQIPHIHALLLIRPEHRRKFQQLIQTMEIRSLASLNIKGIDITLCDDINGGVSRVASYASKYTREQIRHDRCDKAYEFYPDHNGWMKSLIRRGVPLFQTDDIAKIIKRAREEGYWVHP